MADNQKPSELNVQPQSLDAEMAVLGAMLSSREAVSKAIEWLSPDHFYKNGHGKIFSTMIQLFQENEPVDTVSISDRLKKNKDLEAAGGAYYITGLVEAVPTAANIVHYAKVVREKAVLRQLIRLSHDLTHEAYDDHKSADDILDNAERSIFELTQHRLKGGFRHIKPVLGEAFEQLDHVIAKAGSVIGVPSGLDDLDDVTAGFQPGDLIIVAGRPSMGKTALALTMMRNAAVEHSVPVGFFSLEMANQQLAMRLLCGEARVDSSLVRSGKLSATKMKSLSHNVGKLAEAPIFLDDSPALTVLELRAKARRLKAEHDVKLIVVDYLQLMQGPKGVESRQQEISVISRSLKALSKELEIPIVALSQLSRAVEGRQDKRPQLSDLRESGAIEQDADVVMFLFRPWFYMTEDRRQEEFEEKGKAQIIIAKQRNGPTATVHVHFEERFAHFDNLASEGYGEGTGQPPF